MIRCQEKTGGWPMSRLMPMVLAGLIILAGLPIWLIGFFGARDNTNRLLHDQMELFGRTITERLSSQLSPVQTQIDYIARAVRAGQLDPRDERAFGAAIFGALSATPQLGGITLLRPDLSLLRYDRATGTIERGGSAEAVGTLIEIAREDSHQAMWSAPVWSPRDKQAVVAYHAELRDENGFAGVLVAAMTVDHLSEVLTDLLGPMRLTPFILVGRDRALAHPTFVATPPARQADGTALPRIDQIGDPVLATIWTEPHSLNKDLKLSGMSAHWFEGPGENYVTAYVTVNAYGPQPWIAGAYWQSAETRREWVTVMVIGFGGAGLLIVALIVGLKVGRRLGRPIKALAAVARSVEALDFAAVRSLPRGPIAEVNEAAQAFERMGSALAWVETYLPRALVRRLMAQGTTAPPSESRSVTVMFTDLEGYTRLSREQSPEEVADYLNEVIACVGPVIEETGGTIDKYIGDAIMAFWGAPAPQEDHAAAAARAAVAIADCLTRYNAERRAAGKPCCRMRIGIHSGDGLVGNVGFAGRMNYTVIGDVVNFAQRLERHGKTLAEAREEVVILISGATRAALPPEFTVASHPPPASEPVFRLLPATSPALSPEM